MSSSSIAVRVSAQHVETVLAPRGLSAADADRFGIYSIDDGDELPDEFRDHPLAATPALVIPWRSPTGGVLLQLRPDNPIANRAGDLVKYLFPNGSVMVLNRLVEPAPDAPMLIVEGTFQSHVAAKYAPAGWAVYGLSGCWNWRNGDTQTAIPDLIVCEGRDVVLCLDADAASNRHVYDAGISLREAILAENAGSCGFMRLPGAGKKAGLDDVLSVRPEDKRAEWLARRVTDVDEKPAGVKPKLTAKSRAPLSPYIDPMAGGLQVQSLAAAVRKKAPVLLTQEDKIAVYSDGVFRIDGTVLTSILGDLLGEQYRTSHETNVEKFLVGLLARNDERTPLHVDEPLLNCRNGMVDLRTGELLDHSPEYGSTSQIPVEYDPDAKAPVYEQWLSEVIGAQADELEEVAGTMLDPSRTPPKAAFLYGPSRSGKSTFIRLMEAMVGPANRSAVTLHQLCEDRFMAANVYGKMLNAAADLSGAQVEDLSVFKLMTGEDVIQANRKYGAQFAFTNRALFAFSANELPTVGESSRAYVERIKPFRFDRSFAGRENPRIEDEMLGELPGILVRWSAAYRRLLERGAYLPTDPAIMQEFEVRSDRVRQWVDEEMSVVPVDGGTIEPGNGTTPRELARRFNAWAEQNATSRMGERKIIDRLRTITGVVEVHEKGTRRRLLKVVAGKREQNEQNRPTLIKTEATADIPTYMERGESGMERGEGGSEVLVLLARHAAPAPPRICPDCDGPEELVGPDSFWYACPACHPGTFRRER